MIINYIEKEASVDEAVLLITILLGRLPILWPSALEPSVQTTPMIGMKPAVEKVKVCLQNPRLVGLRRQDGARQVHGMSVNEHWCCSPL